MLERFSRDGSIAPIHQNPVSGSFRGDVLKRVGEADIRTADNFYKAVDLNAGKSTPVIVVRDGKELAKQIELDVDLAPDRGGARTTGTRGTTQPNSRRLSEEICLRRDA